MLLLLFIIIYKKTDYEDLKQQLENAKIEQNKNLETYEQRIKEVNICQKNLYL